MTAINAAAMHAKTKLRMTGLPGYHHGLKLGTCTCAIKRDQRRDCRTLLFKTGRL
jgi:hypothetical protein